MLLVYCLSKCVLVELEILFVFVNTSKYSIEMTNASAAVLKHDRDCPFYA